MMTDAEIRCYYRNLHPKQDRVGIIADLNGCRKNEIRRILNVDEPIKKARKHIFDWDKARDLWDLGKTDLEIAEGVNTTRANIYQWRNKQGLEVHKEKREDKRKSKAKFEDALVEAKKADKKKPATINQVWEKVTEEMVAEHPDIIEKAKQYLAQGGFRLDEMSLADDVGRISATFMKPMPTHDPLPVFEAPSTITPAITEPDPWELIKQLEQQILFLRGVAIGAGVRNIDELLAECGT